MKVQSHQCCVCHVSLSESLIHTYTQPHTHPHTLTHTQTHTHSPTHTNTHTHSNTNTHTHTHTHPRTHTHTHPHTHTHTYKHTHTHTYTHTLTHQHTPSHTLRHQHTHTHTSPNTHTNTPTLTHTLPHIHTHSHTNTHTHTHPHTHTHTRTYTDPHTLTHQQTHTQIHDQQTRDKWHNISPSLSLRLIHNKDIALTCKPVRCYTSHQRHSQIWNADSLRTLWGPPWVWAHERQSGLCWALRSHPLLFWPLLQHITNRRPDERPRISWACNSGWLNNIFLEWQPQKAIQVSQHFEGQLYIYHDGQSVFELYIIFKQLNMVVSSRRLPEVSKIAHIILSEINNVYNAKTD